MKFDSNSYIPLESSVVLDLADKRLIGIAEWRRQEWERLIALYRNERAWWKRYMPWLRELTDEEVRKRITLDREWRWSNPGLYHRDTEDTCQSLRRAAKAVPTVYVHTEDYRALSANQHA